MSVKKINDLIIDFTNMDTGQKMKLSNAQAIRKIKNRIFELEQEIENSELEAIKNILRLEIANLRDLINFIEV